MKNFKLHQKRIKKSELIGHIGAAVILAGIILLIGVAGSCDFANINIFTVLTGLASGIFLMFCGLSLIKFSEEERIREAETYKQSRASRNIYDLSKHSA